MSHASTPHPMHSRTWRSRLHEHRDVIGSAVVVAVAFGVVAAVWVGAGFWSYSEQRDGAGALGFDHPSLVFWISDGLMIGGALLALAAALDNRSAPGPKAAVALGIGLSVWFNVAGAAARLGGWQGAPLVAFGMAAGAVVASFIALEILLRAVRTIVRRWRGLPAPVAAPSLRLGRLLLDGRAEFRRWRSAYLDATRPDAAPATLADELRDHAAKLAHVNYLQTTALAERITAELAELRGELDTRMGAAVASVRERLDALPTPAPALDMVDVKAEVGRYTRGVVEGAVRELGAELLADLDSRLAVLRESLPRTTPAAPRSRPRSTGSGSGSGSEDTARMREHWDRERAAGRTPTGAELDRAVGRDPAAGYGRQLVKRWKAEDEAGVSRIPSRATAGA